MPAFVYTSTTDTAAVSGAKPTLANGNFVLHNRVWIGTTNAPEATPCAAADTIDLLAIPPGTYVRNVFVKIVSPATAAAYTMNIGDGTTAAGFDAAVALTAAAETTVCGAQGTDALVTSGKYYATAGVVKGTMATVTTPTVSPCIDVYADCVAL